MMAVDGWDNCFLMPELPATQPWEWSLYCDKFGLWEGSFAVCNAGEKVLSPQAHYIRRCNSSLPKDSCRKKPYWSAEPAAEVVCATP